MKKFLAGVLVGTALTTASSVYASESIQAVLYSVKYIVKDKELPTGGYQTLNYNGHAYLPIRFIAESLGLAIVYNDETKSITIDQDFTSSDPRNANFKVGHIKTTKSGSETLISGKVYLSQTFLEGVSNLGDSASGQLVFWNESGEMLDRVQFKVPLSKGMKDQILDFQTKSAIDVTEYAAVSLEHTIPLQFQHLSGYWMTTNDSNNQVKVGIGSLVRNGEYTVGTLQIGHYLEGLHDIDAEIRFLGVDGEIMGTGRVIASKVMGPLTVEDRPIGMEVTFFTKGDVTNYKDSFEVKVNSIAPAQGLKYFKKISEFYELPSSTGDVTTQHAPPFTLPINFNEDLAHRTGYVEGTNKWFRTGFSISAGKLQPAEKVIVHFRQGTADLNYRYRLTELNNSLEPIGLLKEEITSNRTFHADLPDEEGALYLLSAEVLNDNDEAEDTLLSLIEVPLQAMNAQLYTDREAYRGLDTLELQLENFGPTVLEHGAMYKIEQYENNVWRTLVFENLAFNAIGYRLNSNDTFVQPIKLPGLPKGTYRIVKEIRGEGTKLKASLAANFVVE